MSHRVNISSQRLWLSLFTTSVVALFAVLHVLNDRCDVGCWQRHEKWSVTVITISILCSYNGALTSFLSPPELAQMEILIIVTILGFWCAALPSIMDADNGLAVSPDFAISNANLFFSSYASLTFSLLLLGNYIEQRNGEDASPTAMAWLLLSSASMIVMSAAINILRENGCRNNGSKTCNGTRFAIFGGMVSAAMSLVMVLLRRKAPLECQAIIGFLLVITWACGVSYITFSEGPGTLLGSLYFATWSSFFISVDVTATATTIFIRDENIRKVTGGDENNGGGTTGDENTRTVTGGDETKGGTTGDNDEKAKETAGVENTAAVEDVEK